MKKIWNRNIIISLIIIIILLFYVALLSNISYFDNMLEEYIDSEVGVVRTEKTTKETKTKRVRETKKIKTTIPVETTKKKKTTTTVTTTTSTTTKKVTTTKKSTTTVETTTEVVTTVPPVIYKPHTPSTSRYIVGTWENNTNGIKIRYKFFNDGTFIINNKKKYKYSYDKKTINGSLYIVSDNELLIIDKYQDYEIIRKFIKIN